MHEYEVEPGMTYEQAEEIIRLLDELNNTIFYWQYGFEYIPFAIVLLLFLISFKVGYDIITGGGSRD